MSEILNPDQIAALVEATKQGEVPGSGSASGARRGQQLRPVDFSRPTKFTSDHQRRIARAIESFCQTAAVRLSAELRTAVELEAINSMQLTWSAAQSQLAHGSLSAPLDVEPLGTRMLLTVEAPLVLMGLECLLGGSPDRPPRERRMSEIDWCLTRRLFDSIIHQLSLAWQELAGITLAAGEIEVQSDASQIASVSEPTFMVIIESRVNKHSASLALLIPWMAIEPISEQLAGHEHPPSDEISGEERDIARAMAAVPVTLRAEVAAVELAIEDILGLQVGSVVRLGARADQGVSLFAENVKLGRAHPGANGARRAIQISGTDRRAQ
jgi:flagellar motor switch protein FliM